MVRKGREVGEETTFPNLSSIARFDSVVKEKWIEQKIENTMKSVDSQVEQIHKEWDESQPKPKIIETKSEVEGLSNFEINYDISDRSGTE